MTSMIEAIDPATGDTVGQPFEPMTDSEVSRICDAAASAFQEMQGHDREFRARLLRAMGDQLEARREEIVELGMRETGLAAGRLNGELTRTVYQARRFADVVEEGGFLEAIIDHAMDTEMGPRPDLRRMLVPLGPVAVFGASNFPLAFSVPGGDTMSALAAGCSVVIKAHASHPGLSRLTYDALVEAADSVLAPEGLVGLVHGLEAGVALVQDPNIKAVGFTGSVAGGKALMGLVAERDEPIPFFAEMSSLNPVIVSSAAARDRTKEIADGLAGSVTRSGGQLCTKPGLIFIPADEHGDSLFDELAAAIEGASAEVLLNAGIRDSYMRIGDGLAQVPGMRIAARGGEPDGVGFSVAPMILEIDARSLTHEALEECFGPAAVVVRYSDDQALHAAVQTIPGSLAAGIQAEDQDREWLVEISHVLQPKVGRLLYEGYPTGVHVTWAQHHGGPWPATNSQHTSVGLTATRRFMRPFAWQSAPEGILPTELHEDATGVPRRVDSELVVPDEQSLSG